MDTSIFHLPQRKKILANLAEKVLPGVGSQYIVDSNLVELAPMRRRKFRKQPHGPVRYSSSDIDLELDAYIEREVRDGDVTLGTHKSD